MRLRTFCLLPLLGVWMAGATRETEVLRERMAVVERERLWQSHPGFARLTELDFRVATLEAQRKDLLDRACHSCDTQLARGRAQQLWDSQQAEMRQQIESASRDFQERTQNDLKQIHARFEGKLSEITRESRLPSQEMLALAVTRYRLDKQKGLDLQIQAEQQRRNLELARQDDLAARQVQEQKLNLQLALQVKDDDLDRRRLSQLDEALADERGARHQRSAQELEAWVVERRARLQGEVADYQARLLAESQLPLRQFEALGAAERQEFKRVQETRKAQLMQVVRQLEAVGRQRFQQKLGNLKSEHSVLGELIPQRFLSSAEAARLARLPALIRETRQTRQREQARLAQGVSEVVGTQARKRGVEVVLTDPGYDCGLQDLTDVCLAGVSQLR